jgi:hypothetical protein
MRSLACIASACLAIGSLGEFAPGTAHAQNYLPGTSGYGPYSQANRPGFSPYLLLPNSSNPAITYYGIIRPQISQGNSIQGLEYQQQALASSQQTGAAFYSANLPVPTGHATGFLNQQSYFQNQRSGAGFGSPQGAPGALGAPTRAP